MLSTQKPKHSSKKEDIKTVDNKEQIEENQQINIVTVQRLTPDKYMVIHDKDSNKFIIKDNEVVKGFFTPAQIFKYLNDNVEGFLLDTDIITSKDVINNYICKQVDDTYELVPHTSSPITGNIDILVKLYKELVNFEQEKLQVEYEKLSSDVASSVRTINRDFIYTVLVQIIKLFSIYTSSQSVTNIQVKDLIMKYTIGAVYKLSVMIKEDLDINTVKIKSLTSDLENLKRIRENMNLQIEDLNKTLEVENTKIDEIILNMELNRQKGGGDSDGDDNNLFSSGESDTKDSDKNNSDTDNSEEPENPKSETSHNKKNNSSSYNSVTPTNSSKKISSSITSSFMTSDYNKFTELSKSYK